MILTAAFERNDIAIFDGRRQKHFPASRNFLPAHLTMFHRIDDIHLSEIRPILSSLAAETAPLTAVTTGVRHLGRGVAFAVKSEGLALVRTALRNQFKPWLCPQDLESWQPHITVQNGVDIRKADRLFDELQAQFTPETLAVVGYQLWHYKGGPWLEEATYSFRSALALSADP